MIERVCTGLNELGAAKYAQAVVQRLLLEVAVGSYHGIEDIDKALCQVAGILKHAASATLHNNGFPSTAAFSHHLRRHRPDDSPIAEIVDDLAASLCLAAAERVRCRRRGRHAAPGA